MGGRSPAVLVVKKTRRGAGWSAMSAYSSSYYRSRYANGDGAEIALDEEEPGTLRREWNYRSGVSFAGVIIIICDDCALDGGRSTRKICSSDPFREVARFFGLLVLSAISK